MDTDPLLMIGPLDGRYYRLCAPLREYVSEFALIRYRILVEIEWFIYCSKHIPNFLDNQRVGDEEFVQCRQVFKDFSLADAQRVRAIERETNHDVKAVEQFLREKFSKIGLGPACELIHFGCTSEDINNLAYALMTRDIRQQILQPHIGTLITAIIDSAEKLADVPMLARTHGQPASPTTMGKELALFAQRLHRATEIFESTPILGKINGAVGNFNAHKVAFSEVNWLEHSKNFVESLGLTHNPFTAQIEPHDFLANYCNALHQVNTVLLDFVRDMWAYISIDYFQQRLKADEVGSSTMPHKVNPIDFENAEGNLGISNALLQHLSAKLPISRWQRDLSDSTVLRNLGVAFGHAFIAFNNAHTGFQKIDVNLAQLNSDLENSWEVLSEAVQTLMRSRGIDNAYELVKKLSRGVSMDRLSYFDLVDELPLDETDKDRLKSLTPHTYIGYASEIAKDIISRVSANSDRH
ncbi:MAG: adenylosuccinate lyase [Gammaproteobacteria bacterium]|nr:adenylosuccinate lyase [Gammaproteobacteria bacterium]MDE0252841.1 adenylosuccinate lyase [Gammaproteobacteria bacterium]MDE0402146.1 adenylosuccinate lyase [Gammaproteobacteria bacterium]